MRTILLACFSLAVFSCTKTDPDPLLLGCWAHIQEEQHPDGYQVFNDCSVDLPLTHYRIRFELKPDGIAEYSVLSPVDAHYLETGTWKYNKNSGALSITSPSGAVAYAYRVVEVSEDLLLLALL